MDRRERTTGANARHRHLLAVAWLTMAMLATACGSPSGDDAAATTTVVAGGGNLADAASGVFMVRVQHEVDEAAADEALAVLAANGFDEFTKEASAGDGFDVVAQGLTEDGASALVVRLTTDPDVSYLGVIFEES